MSYLKCVWVEEDRVGQVRDALLHVRDDPCQVEDPIVEAVAVASGAQLAVRVLDILILHSHVHDDLKRERRETIYLLMLH